MKRLLIIFSLVFLVGIVFSQEKVIIEKGYMILTEDAAEYYQKLLPAGIDFSESDYFPPIYHQTHWVCNQTASSYYMMTFETNKMLDLNSSIPENQFSVYFPWNFGNGGNGWYGDNYVISMEMMKQLGVPKLADCEADLLRDSSVWLNGYEYYYNAMHNKIGDYLRIRTNTLTGLTTLKSWVYDNCGSGYYGGTATFLANIAENGSTYFASGTPEEGAYAITKCGDDALHARTIVGYSDNVCFDYNDDGEYTNDIDLNGDGIIDVRDYEKGGFKLAESFGPDWQGDGFCWIMYKCMADAYPEGGILNNYVHIIKPDINYSPDLTAKIILKHESRERIKVKIGISSDINSDTWEYIQDFPIFNFQGGNKYMQGGTSEADKTIEFGLDITPLISYFNESNQAKLFIVVEESDPGDVYEGKISEFSIMDYTGNEVYEYSYVTPTQLNNDGQTSASVVVSMEECNVPRILTETLPVLSSENSIWFELDYEGGTAPYHWEILPYFEMEQFSAEFDSFDGTKLTPDSDFNGSVNLELPFEFPIENYYTDIIQIHSDGYILPFSATNVWTQLREHLYPLFINETLIAPLARFSLVNDFESGDGIWYKFEQDTVKIRWKSSDKSSEAWTSIDFGCDLVSDGTIIFSYGQDYLKSMFTNIGGISFGNQSDNIIAWMDDVPDNGTKIKIKPYPVPVEIHINEEGTIYGNPGVLNAYPFRVRITDAKNVSHTVKYDLTTGFDEISSENQNVIIYPNPASSSITVDFSNTEYDFAEIKILNNTGELLKTTKLVNKESIKISISDFKSGVFIIELNIDGEYYYNKFVKI